MLSAVGCRYGYQSVSKIVTLELMRLTERVGRKCVTGGCDWYIDEASLTFLLGLVRDSFHTGE